MDSLYIIYFIYISLMLLIFFAALKALNIGNINGKKLVKLNDNSLDFYFWTIILIVACLAIFLTYKKVQYSDNLLIYLFFINLSFLNIVRSYKYSQITQKGIYLERYFYKWSKIKCYQWINLTSNKVGLKIKLYLGMNIK